MNAYLYNDAYYAGLDAAFDSSNPSLIEEVNMLHAKGLLGKRKNSVSQEDDKDVVPAQKRIKNTV